jgi:hypothetical protein
MVVAALPQTMDALRRSQGSTDATLGSFDHLMYTLEAAMHPTQVRAFSYIPNFTRLRDLKHSARECRQDHQARQQHPLLV